jgi:hypothetical protein
MTAAAIDRRLKALEQKAGKANRPLVAFVIWERTRQEAEATLEHALVVGAVKRGDPIIMGVLPGDGDLPEPRWSDVAGLSDAELNALAVEEQRKVDAGEARLGSSAEWAAVRQMSDSELFADLVSKLPRVA